MKEDKILTIVVPVYNMERFLCQCLDSLILSGGQKSCLDVIIVNDGSKDGSLEIMREYEAKYPDIFRVYDKENGGHGSCWNVGLDKAKGKYISFLDSDDWYDSDGLIEMLNVLECSDSDVVITKYYNNFEKDGSQHPVVIDGLEYGRKYDAREFDFFQCKFRFELFNTFFSTKLLKAVGASFREHVSYDDSVLAQWGCYGLTFFETIDTYVYHYRIGRCGQSFDPKVFRKKVNDWLYSATDAFSIYDNINMLVNRNVLIHLQNSLALKVEEVYSTIHAMNLQESIRTHKLLNKLYTSHSFLRLRNLCKYAKFSRTIYGFIILYLYKLLKFRVLKLK